MKAGCNGCHAPLAFLAGDIPPKRPAEGTRANEGVSCDLCHSITGFEGDTPFNFNFTIEPGEAKQGTRAGVESPGHEINVSPFLGSAEFCGTCHNEKDPMGSLGQGHPPGVEGEPSGEGRYRLSGLPHAQGRGELGARGRRCRPSGCPLAPLPRRPRCRKARGRSGGADPPQDERGQNRLGVTLMATVL